ncbi:MAG: signal peptidase I [bacterium]|nr:signal peptidase I [bacterium]
MESPLDGQAAQQEQEHFSGSPVCDETPFSLAELMAPDRASTVGSGTAGEAVQAPVRTHVWVQPKPKRRTIFGLLLGCMLTVMKVCLPLAVIASLSFNYSEVRGASMRPGIHDRDRILVDHVSYSFVEVERGDIIVLRYPLDPSLDYIKRVVALPGDEVVIQYGGLWVNGQPVEQPYVDVKSLDPSTTLRTKVKEGHYFVLGDNRIRSSDSREFGQVKKSLVRGKVRFRIWPLDRVGLIR